MTLRGGGDTLTLHGKIQFDLIFCTKRWWHKGIAFLTLTPYGLQVVSKGGGDILSSCTFTPDIALVKKSILTPSCPSRNIG